MHAQTGMKNLCLAGGVALNCVGNGRILREGPFENIWIQPAAGDAGGALGVGAVHLASTSRTIRVSRTAGDAQSGIAARARNSRMREIQDVPRCDRRAVSATSTMTTSCCEHVADLIADEKVVGWFQGRMEFGPRALGAAASSAMRAARRCSR